MLHGGSNVMLQAAEQIHVAAACSERLRCANMQGYSADDCATLADMSCNLNAFLSRPVTNRLQEEHEPQEGGQPRQAHGRYGPGPINWSAAARTQPLQGPPLTHQPMAGQQGSRQRVP
jgi:hypothetical protein